MVQSIDFKTNSSIQPTRMNPYISKSACLKWPPVGTSLGHWASWPFPFPYIGRSEAAPSRVSGPIQGTARKAVLSVNRVFACNTLVFGTLPLVSHEFSWYDLN